MFELKNSYYDLSSSFYSTCIPRKSPDPSLKLFNDNLYKDLTGKDNELSNSELAQFLSGNKIFKTSKPLAMAYAGHQFGHFVSQLGDGRAILLGEIITHKKDIYDIQLKGAGRTYFSRRGDGKYPLGPAIREYILSESMNQLKVPTTRALALTLTGEEVYREESSKAAVLTRIASSHIRIGSFEYFAARKDNENLKKLTDYCIKRHYSYIKEDKYISFFKEVTTRQVQLVSRWISFGFIHGVMNTDNTSISGETIDYGPCAFMEQYKKNKVFSSIDRNGRYSFSNQKNIILWNLSSLANCIAHIIPKDNIKYLEEILSNSIKEIDNFSNKLMLLKLGLKKQSFENLKLLELWLEYLETENLDFTLSFWNLKNLLEGNCEFYPKTKEFEEFNNQWKKNITKETKETLLKSNPIFIPRNYLIQEAIDQASQNNFTYTKELLKASKKPYEKIKELDHLYLAEPVNKRVFKTFCGT